MGNLQGLDCDFIAGGVKGRPRPFGRPTVAEIPTQFFFTSVINEYNRSVLSLYLAIDGFLPPLPE